MADRAGLEWHGNQWRAQVRVPARVVEIVGKKKLVRGLRTDSLARANLLKWPVLAEFHKIIAEADRERAVRGGSGSSRLVIEAQDFRDELHKALADPMESAVLDEHGHVVADGPRFIRGLIDDRAQELNESHGAADASLFYGLASGTKTPLLHYADPYLAEANMKPRQQTGYRTALRNFDRWLTEVRKPCTVEVVTTKVAGEYVSKAFSAKAVHWKTTNKAVSCLSSYWRWLMKKGHAEVNPWQGQSVKKRETPEDERKRPFTDDEFRALMAGDASVLLRDFMMIAALSGLRIEEIARIEARDVAADAIKVRVSKTAAGRRTVPVHPDLQELFTRRCIGRTGTDAIFPELPAPKSGSAVERSQPVSKQFTRYRRKLNVDAVAEGKRQSVIDFHSFRRWFAQKARDAIDGGAQGYSYWMIAEVLGHETEAMPLGMTMRYAGKGQADPRRACVEAVRAPAVLRVSDLAA